MKLTTATILLVSALAANADGVKYRGIFVNDEDWSLRPWAVKHFGKKEQIGIRAYEEIFSLMEKDGLNLIWPAMHEGGYEFSSRPENLELAKKHGIVVGTSHCEPMLRNNCYLSKEDKKKWSWTTNRDFLVDYWKEGVKRGNGERNRPLRGFATHGEANTPSEASAEGRGKRDGILWTIGMRGIHDGKMQDGKTTEEKIKILEEVFAAQCAMLPEGAPKLFVPYKEVLPIFNAGLKVPKDATIMWTNDNFGYVRRVGGPQCEGYGGGICWHASYHGFPHGYIHLCTTPPAFMWYELVAKCWENGVRDVWMVNAGDVFQAEILLDAYGRFASDPEEWGSDAQPKALAAWVREKLELEVGVGEWNRSSSNSNSPLQLGDRIVAHLAEYYNLGFNRRPEHMCVQWATNLPTSVKSSLLKRYHALLAEDVEIEAALGEWGTGNGERIRDRYFRLVGFQARFLAYAGIIHLEGRDKEYARSVIDPLYERWDKLDNGKWSGFWCDTIDERGGKRQPTAHNRWSSQMQWPWNEPADPYNTKDRGVARVDYPATAYRADIAEPVWLEPVANTPANSGAWTRVEGLGTSGRALALLPVKLGVGNGAAMEFSLTGLTGFEKLDDNPVNLVNPVQKKTLVLQFLPDFALWPGLKLGVEVSFDDGTVKYVAVPKSDANIGEHDPVRNRAVQDNFIRVEVPVPAGAKSVKIVATDPGVVIDRVGIRAPASLAWPEPTREMKPWVYNWWMGSAVDKAGLEFQCRELADKGFGGFHVIPIYGAKGGYEKNWKPLLSPHWIEAWNLAAGLASDNGLGIDLTMGSGWCFGGPWIDKEHAASSGQKVKRAGLGGTGYMLDPFDPEAMKLHIAQYDNWFGKDGKAAHPRAFYHDSYEYYGAEPKKGGDVDESQLACFRVWADWCRDNGYLTRNEAHGAPSNWLDFYALADVPETEMFGKNDRDILVSKFASSAAHVKGTKLVSAESCTWIDEHFRERPAEIKQFIDRLFLAGVNHVFYHGCCYSPVEAVWPGWCFYASLEMNPRNPIWREMGAMNEYVTRCQSLFQTWTPDNDLAILWDPAPYRAKHQGKVMNMSIHNRDEWFYGEKVGKVAKELYEAGYAFDYVSPRMVKDGLAKKYAVVVDPEAPKYEELKGVRKMPFDAASGLLATRWKKDGETAYFVVNTGTVARAVVAGSKPYGVMNPLTGEIETARRAAIEVASGHSLFLVGDSFEVTTVGKRTCDGIAVAGPWEVSPICGGPVLNEPRKLDVLVGWETFDEFFSGTMLYKTTFDFAGANEGAVLSLGDVRDIARVRLNGRDLGVKFMPPYDFAIPSGILRDKENVLEVEVTNLGANRLRWNDLNKVDWKYFSDINMVGIDYKKLDASKWKPLPSGLFTPVRVMAVVP